jgi:hypothetical protein
MMWIAVDGRGWPWMMWMVVGGCGRLWMVWMGVDSGSAGVNILGGTDPGFT